MEEPQRTDLTYITERIITVLCPAECPEPLYQQNLQEILVMLQSKHQHNCMLINVSQKNEALNRLKHKVLDTGWLDHLAPNLDQIFSVCSSMEKWLQTHPRRVVVLHCRGGKGQLAVLVASYIDFSSMLNSADLSLDHFAMRRFYSNKLSALMTPSQKRYVWLVRSILKGGLKVSPSPLFLFCVVLHGLPRLRLDGECGLFLRIYQGSQAVCTSAVHPVSAPPTDQLRFELRPARLLQGDVLVICYMENSGRALFRLQFHMGLVSRHALTFLKPDLDCASEDPNFPEDGKVEVLLSDSPEKIKGTELWSSGRCDPLDPLDPLDPAVRRNTSPRTDSHFLNPEPCDLLKRSCEDDTSGSLGDRTPSASSDSGLSVASQGRRRGPTHTGGLDFEIALPLLEVMTELAAQGRGDAVAVDSGLGATLSRAAPSRECQRESLGDEQEAAEVLSSSSIGSVLQNLPDSWIYREEHGREAVLRGAEKEPANDPHTSSDPEDDLTSLTADADKSIMQLNQLILDLDPTFVPVPSHCSALSRSTSLHADGISQGETQQTGWRRQKQLSELVDYAGLSSPGRRSSPTYSPSCSTSQGRFFNSNIMEDQGDTFSSDMVRPTPAFPVSPPTPYVRLWPEYQRRAGSLQAEHNWTPDSRSFLDSPNHSGSTEGGLLGAEVAPGPRQRSLGSMCSVSSESSVPPTDSATPPSWHDRIPTPQSSPLLSVSTPNASSSPRGAFRGLTRGLGLHREMNSTDLPLLLLGNGSLEHSLLEAVEDLKGLNLGVGQKGPPPVLPEKRRGSESRELLSHSPSLSGSSSPHSSSSLPFSSPMSPDSPRGVSGVPSPGADFGSKTEAVKFVQDTSKFWYKPDISRDQAIAVLKDKDPGAFIVRDSHSFRGAYGLAMKVATPPPSVLQQSKKGGDLASELVRHFLIECTQRGVRLKGCPNEPYFGSLTALVCQHSITPLALPCKLILPDRDPMLDLNEKPSVTAANSAAELLRQGAACNVWYLGSVALESLTGHQAVQKATTLTISMDPPPQSTVVHFKVSAQGITLTDNQRKLFFRRHYAVSTVIFCSLDPQGRKWTRGSSLNAKLFGFVARKDQSETENMCHLFAEHDPEQPASAIVNFVSKVMIGSHKK